MPNLTTLRFEERTPILFRGVVDKVQQKQQVVAPSTTPPVILNGTKETWNKLPAVVQDWVGAQTEICQPRNIHIMNGSETERAKLTQALVTSGVMTPLPQYDNCFHTRTDPADVARVESKTFISTPIKKDTIPDVAEGVDGKLGKWMAPEQLDKKIGELFPGCMKGRTMYVIPFSMGPVGGHLSYDGIELSDSAYVAVSMTIMTRVGDAPMRSIKKRLEKGDTFIKCLHSVGQPLKDGEESAVWPCNPEKTLIAHRPHSGEIISFGSGYGGNSLLGKKCFALRLGSYLAKKQGRLAEHMLIMGIKTPGSEKRRYVLAAFPSACGKTNLAMLCPSLEDYDVTCVGDDIAWLGFDQDGSIRAINPENGFFGVAPGTSWESNPNAMHSIFKNTLFTNVALTDEGGVWWEGMSAEAPEHLVDWKGQDWTPDCGRKAAHPNSRFCAPAENCPIIDEDWQNEDGVKIDAILFGGRRPEGVPLVAESMNWQHGVFMGAALKSEATAAAEHKGKMVMHDPMSMRPFLGYNFGHYLDHWLSLGKEHANKGNLPRIFNVNWFRKGSADGKFLWPGFGENIRVLDWILRRCDGYDDIAVESPVGYLPAEGALKMEGLEDSPVDWEELFSTPKSFWMDEVAELRNYFNQQVGDSLPEEIAFELNSLEERFQN